MGKFDERIEEFGLLVGDHERARRVEDIELARILPDPGNPRRSFDDDALAELAASIASRGVLQPITVTPPDAKGLATIPAIVVPVGEGVQLLADQIVENDQRANLSSVELAHAIARMLKGGMNQVEIAAALGRSKQFVSLYAAYGDMPAYLKAALPFAPIRLLYDLHRTARDYPAEVEAYVASWGDAGATLAAGSRFIAELKQTHPAPVPPRAPVAQPLAPTDRDPVRSGLTDKPSAPIRSPRLPVLVDGFPAWLPLAPLVTVIFEDGREREVAASSIGPTGERSEALPTTDPPPPRS
jgi:ParB family chromosome partitioning protein